VHPLSTYQTRRCTTNETVAGRIRALLAIQACAAVTRNNRCLSGRLRTGRPVDYNNASRRCFVEVVSSACARSNSNKVVPRSRLSWDQPIKMQIAPCTVNSTAARRSTARTARRARGESWSMRQRGAPAQRGFEAPRDLLAGGVREGAASGPCSRGKRTRLVTGVRPVIV